jgi:heme exporter protein A
VEIGQFFATSALPCVQATVFRLTGPNGSGKTSLLRMLCGLLPPAHGTICWMGTNIHKLDEDYFSEMTYIGHRHGVKDELTALENLRVSCGLSGIEISRQSAVSALARMRLEDRIDTPARLLSEGQRRRVALARLLVRRTSLWLLDEVMTSLDTEAVQLVQWMIEEHLFCWWNGRGCHASGTDTFRGPFATNRVGGMTTPSLAVMFRWLLWREIVLAWRRKTDVLSTVAFFVIVVTLFPLGMDPEPRLLRVIAPGIVWVAALLASMLALQRLYASDYADGSLEQMMVGPQPLVLVVAGKLLAQWLVTGNSAGADFTLAGTSVWIGDRRKSCNWPDR